MKCRRENNTQTYGQTRAHTHAGDATRDDDDSDEGSRESAAAAAAASGQR